MAAARILRPCEEENMAMSDHSERHRCSTFALADHNSMLMLRDLLVQQARFAWRFVTCSVHESNVFEIWNILGGCVLR